MNISRLVSTEEREKILAYLLSHPSESVNMNGLARKLDLSPGQIHKYVGILKQAGLFKDGKLLDIPIVRAFRIVLNIRGIEKAGVAAALLRNFPKAEGIGIYGSFASGGNSENSDLDLWVKIGKEPKDAEIARARRELEDKLGFPVDIIIATPERLANFREKSDAFYFSLYYGITLWGESL